MSCMNCGALIGKAEDMEEALRITKASRDAWVDESIHRLTIIQALRQPLQKWVEMFGDVVQPGTEGAELIAETQRALSLKVERPAKEWKSSEAEKP